MKNIWKDKYKQVPQQLEKIKQIQTAATGFNANIDAVLKINGEMLKNLIIKNNISLAEIENISLKGFRKPQDVILGIIK
ncbi:MAG: hypothetical protein J6W96_00360, partial [Alphaproteobacteria bacterium]|nr:hypothetical protein [Alphaproteobacteria bacterium]